MAEWLPRSARATHPTLHPYSPSGGCGAGAARLPGPVTAGIGECHQDAPGTRLTWDTHGASSGITRQGGVGRSSLVDAIAKLLDVEDAALRSALPDRALEVAYDRHLVDVKAIFRNRQLVGGRGLNRDALLDRMRDATSWIDATRLASRLDAAPRLPYAGGGSRADVQAFAAFIGGAFAIARGRLEERWSEASRDLAGRQTLIAEWLRRLDYDRGRPSGVERTSKVERVTPRQLIPREPAEKPAKTWVEFQLLDAAGKAAAGVAYEITLPDGSTQRGRIGADGAVRFENIDPGQCQVRFPELDARDWKPA